MGERDTLQLITNGALLIDRLIDCIVFYVVVAIFQRCNGGASVMLKKKRDDSYSRMGLGWILVLLFLGHFIISGH